jgi:hypothetical protein
MRTPRPWSGPRAVRLPISHRGVQDHDEAPQAVFEVKLPGAAGQQQTTQLVQLPPLFALGVGDQGLLQRLVDGVQRRVHGLFVDQTVESPAIRSRHLLASIWHSLSSSISAFVRWSQALQAFLQTLCAPAALNTPLRGPLANPATARRSGQPFLQQHGPADQGVAALADAGLDLQVEIAGFMDPGG